MRSRRRRQRKGNSQEDLVFIEGDQFSVPKGGISATACHVAIQMTKSHCMSDKTGTWRHSGSDSYNMMTLSLQRKRFNFLQTLVPGRLVEKK
ncbi:Phosphatidylinositol 4-Phosphate 5-Kinase Type-1 Alpha [Manis pentadactyla]|nr:Phosphatidylinositol 4-Phosphate 5-Kinase Type-1 Alpha [Manis pentadactyla]